VITSRRFKWTRHIEGIGEGEVLTGFWCVNLRVGDHIEDTDIDGIMI